MRERKDANCEAGARTWHGQRDCIVRMRNAVGRLLACAYRKSVVFDSDDERHVENFCTWQGIRAYTRTHVHRCRASLLLLVLSAISMEPSDKQHRPCTRIVCIYVCTHTYMCTCMYVCVCIYIYTHKHIINIYISSQALILPIYAIKTIYISCMCCTRESRSLKKKHFFWPKGFLELLGKARSVVYVTQ
jgi:hypothetical protein